MASGNTRSRLLDQISLLQPQATALSTSYLTQVHAGFVFKREAEDAQFHFLHVEPLLDQAADLLDRGLAQRASWDALAIQMTEQWLDLGKFSEEDEVRRKEDAAGVHSLPAIEAAASAEAERRNATQQQNLSQQVGRISDSFYSGEVINKQLDAIRKGAFLTGVAAYEYKGQTFSGYVEHTYTPVAGDSIKGRVQDFALQSAETIGRRSLLQQKEETIVQERTFSAAAAVSKARLPGVEAREQYSVKATEFSRSRVEIDRKYHEYRQRAATEPDGALNFARRLLGIRERFSQDFRDALARLKAVQPGMNLLYGYELKLPDDESSVDYFDKCLLETRRALQWIIRFSRLEQSTVVPMSVRKLTGEAAWTSGFQTGEWTFDVSRDLFSGMELVRIRGVSAFASFTSKNGLLGVQVSIPKSGLLVSERGATSIDQARLPPCRLLRVLDRYASRDSDVVGVSVLHNASPIGTWRAQILSAPTEPISDLYIDVLVNYRARPLP